MLHCIKLACVVLHEQYNAEEGKDKIRDYPRIALDCDERQREGDAAQQNPSITPLLFIILLL